RDRRPSRGRRSAPWRPWRCGRAARSRRRPAPPVPARRSARYARPSCPLPLNRQLDDSYSDTHIATIFRVGPQQVNRGAAVRILKTPEDRFAGLADWPYAPRYAIVIDADGTAMQMHYVDEGPPDGPVV